MKAKVAATAVRLQSAEDFGTFSSTLLSRLSEAIPLLYAAFYLTDDSRSRVDLVGTFALHGTPDPASFALGEALVGQAALEKRTLEISPAKREALRVSTGIGSVAAGKVLFVMTSTTVTSHHHVLRSSKSLLGCNDYDGTGESANLCQTLVPRFGYCACPE